MKKLLYVLTGLCLLAGAFTSCEDPLKEPDGANNGGGTSTEKTGTLKGKVTDKETGLPLELAMVELTPGEKKTVTDQNGEFAFAELLPGNYALKVSKLGYKTVESGAIAVKAVETVRQEIAMEKEQTDLRIVNEESEDIERLETCGGNKMSFTILNAGTHILEWEIPRVAAEWVKDFSKESGKLSPGASEKIEFSCKPFSEDAEAVIYIMSNGGNKQLKVYNYKFNDYTETILELNMPMISAVGGTYTMGATSEQGSSAKSDELPVHSVKVSSFYIGKYEVTQRQWEAVMGTTIEQQRDKAGESKLYGVGGEYPMYYVSWEEAQEFCQKLSEMTGKTYRLPTEAEWEFAAKGCNGWHLTIDNTKYAGSNTKEDVAWCYNVYDAMDGRYTRMVGTKKPNGLGLYDMSGNVAEWCSDWYNKDYYSSSPSVNPQGPANGSYRVLRGGSFRFEYVDCRVTARGGTTPDRRDYCLGFRVACSVK